MVLDFWKVKLRRYLPFYIIGLCHTWEFRKNIKACRKVKNKRSINRKPKIVFIIQYPEVWNTLATIYASADNIDLQPLILCVPKLSDSSVNSNNEAYEYFTRNNVPAVNAYDIKSKKWFDLEKYSPDYVIYARTYDAEYPEQYKSRAVCGYTKICYVPYAYNNTLCYETFITYATRFIYVTYITFVQSPIMLEACRKRFYFLWKFLGRKFVYLGCPRFDLVKKACYSYSNGKLKRRTILWMPRWCVHIADGQRTASHFIKYYEKFLSFMEKHTDLNLIIRPHPLMFETILQKKIMTNEELDEWVKRADMLPNVQFDSHKDYMNAFRESDILVSDFSSLLIEYFITGKPIIYCSPNTDFTEDALRMDATLYHADCWGDIEKQLEVLIYENNDPMQEERLNLIPQLIPHNAGHIGEDIMKYILEDFRLEKEKSAKKVGHYE